MQLVVLEHFSCKRRLSLWTRVWIRIWVKRQNSPVWTKIKGQWQDFMSGRSPFPGHVQLSPKIEAGKCHQKLKQGNQNPISQRLVSWWRPSLKINSMNFVSDLRIREKYILTCFIKRDISKFQKGKNPCFALLKYFQKRMDKKSVAIATNWLVNKTHWIR